MNICVFCGANPGNPSFQEKAKELGKLIASRGHRLVYGGSSLGLMGLVASSAKGNDGEITSIIPEFFLHDGLNDPYADERLVVKSMSERKKTMVELSDLFIALPGGIGTLDEIGDVLTLIALRQKSAKLILCDFDNFYEHLDALLSRMKKEGYIPSGSWIAEPIYAQDIEEIESYL